MTSYPMEKEENAARLIELVKRTIASPSRMMSARANTMNSAMSAVSGDVRSRTVLRKSKGKKE
jgi:hypothetical protein